MAYERTLIDVIEVARAFAKKRQHQPPDHRERLKLSRSDCNCVYGQTAAIGL
jgi:hypothetical protein